jgi:YHS domain-containing protein
MDIYIWIPVSIYSDYGDIIMAVDPVCGMEVDEKTTRHKIEYEGKIYYFCCEHCMKAFQSDPKRYL